MEGNFVKMSSRDSHFGIMNRVAGMIRVASMEVGSASFVIHLTGNKIMQVIG